MPTDVTTQSIAEKISLKIIPITLIGVGFSVVAAAGLFFSNLTTKTASGLLTCSSPLTLQQTVFDTTSLTKIQQVTNNLNTLSTSYQQVSSKQTAAQIQSLAQQRKNLLLATWYGPTKNSSVVELSGAARKVIGQLTSGCLEEQVALRGVLRFRHTHTESGSTDQYQLVTATKTYELAPASASLMAVDSSLPVLVSGTIMDNTLLVDASNPVDVSIASSAAVLPEPHGVWKTLVILYNHNTNRTTPTTTDWSNFMSQQVNQFLKEVTYKQNAADQQGFSLEGWLNPGAAADVVGYVATPTQAVVDDHDIFQATHEQFPQVNFLNYQLIILVAPGGAVSASAGAYAGFLTPDGYINAHSVASSYFSSFSSSATQIISHEIGHTLGLGHANRVTCGSQVFGTIGANCTYYEYGNPFDTMAGPLNGPSPHFGSQYKFFNSWFKTGNMETISAPGTYARTLEPLETISGNLKSLRIQRNQSHYLFVDYRQRIGVDTDMPGTDADQGAMVHIDPQNSATPQNILVDATPVTDQYSPTIHPGSNYYDAADDIRVTVPQTQSVPGKLMVTITIGPNYDITPPVVTISNPAADGQVWTGGSVALTATVTDTVTPVQSVTFSDTQGGFMKTLATMTVPTTGTNLNGTYTTMVDSRLLPNGQNTVSVIASDGKGNTSTSVQRVVTVNNVDGVLPVLTINGPANGTEYAPTVSPLVSASASDNIGIWKFEIYLDAGQVPVTTKYNSQTFFAAINLVTSGQHVITVKVYDFVGNVASGSRTVYSRYDGPSGGSGGLVCGEEPGLPPCPMETQ